MINEKHYLCSQRKKNSIPYIVTCSCAVPTSALHIP